MNPMILTAIAGFFLVLVVSFLRKTDKYEDFCVAAFVLLFVIALLPLGPIEGYLRPFTWDARLRQVDLALGLDGFALARYCFAHSWARLLLSTTYSVLPFIFALNWTLERSKSFLRAAVIGALCAVPLYLLIPACGPQYVFPGYPWHTEIPYGLIAASIIHPRNCFPSMHFSWALLLALYSRNRYWKLFLFGYAALMALATVGGGEHYFIDVIAGLPFTFFIRRLEEFFATQRLVVFKFARRA